MKAITLLLYIVASVSATTTKLYDDFVDYMITYDKQYSYDEFMYRYDVFAENVQRIQEHNNNNHNWKMEINAWTDRTWDEFAESRIGLNLPSNVFESESFAYIFDESDYKQIPDYLDWRERGVVNPVKNQGRCGSCWAFSGVSAIESAHALKYNQLYNLSEQQLVDCSTADNGCNGGLMDDVFEYATRRALCTAEEYPYNAHDGTCKPCKGVVRVQKFVDITSRNEQDILKALLKQPLSVAIEADQRGFQFYTSGVFDGECGTNLDHGVVLVGYGKENGLDYWLIRNSWGDDWGDEGYIKIRRGTNQCGIALQASYPVVV